MKRALISVSDKRGVAELARGLVELDFEIVSTGGTLELLRSQGIDAISISDVTGFEECLDGRVKTLHPAVHGGLLALRDNEAHMVTLERMGIACIDVVAVNLYPFAKTIAKEGVSFDEAVENIDIGGPSMVRSASKNYQSVLILTDPDDYGLALERIKNNTLNQEFRLQMMCKAFAHTASYDALIASYLREKCGVEGFADTFTPTFVKSCELRYGENPHQKGAFYTEINAKKGTIAHIKKLCGKDLSFLNIADISASVELLKEFDCPAVVAVKHAIPCGVACADTVLDAYLGAFECDPISIFGGIVAVNRVVDADLATEMVKTFLEVVVAPKFCDKAVEIFKSKPNLRLIELSDLDKRNQPYLDFKRVSGGILLQQNDLITAEKFDIVCGNVDEKRKKELEFALKVVKHVKSNAIVLVNGFKTVGISGGETNRVWATEQAILRAGNRARGAVVASDAFFPFSDSVEACIKAGVVAIIQPGGSIRDVDSIELCRKSNIAMVLCHTRHFKH